MGSAWRHVGLGLGGATVDLVEPGADARHGEHAMHELVERVLALHRAIEYLDHHGPQRLKHP